MWITPNNIYPKLFVISPEIAKEINFFIFFFYIYKQINTLLEVRDSVHYINFFNLDFLKLGFCVTSPVLFKNRWVIVPLDFKYCVILKKISIK